MMNPTAGVSLTRYAELYAILDGYAVGAHTREEAILAIQRIIEAEVADVSEER